MNSHQSGFGVMQVLLVVVAIGLLSLFAVPKYNAAMTKAKNYGGLYAGRSIKTETVRILYGE